MNQFESRRETFPASSGTGVHISLDSSHLLSGSRAKILDSLRDQVDNNSSIESPLDAECESMTEDELDRIFKGHGTKAYFDSWSSPNKAEACIQYCYNASNNISVHHDDDEFYALLSLNGNLCSALKIPSLTAQ
ncbi:hypothetical protein HD806DRAFT_532045 [Xylariaceae sp. AK1471]|nr:hypothetical protein HD806DRAFT_532045 [Xylariaceae sp. AK1471]